MIFLNGFIELLLKNCFLYIRVKGTQLDAHLILIIFRQLVHVSYNMTTDII